MPARPNIPGRGKAPLKKTAVPDQTIPTNPNRFRWPYSSLSPRRFRICPRHSRRSDAIRKAGSSIGITRPETAVQVLIDEWITQFDLPEVIGSDQGPHFTAHRV